MSNEPVWRRYRGFRGPDIRRDVDDEFEFHVATRAAEYVAAGMSPAAARERAIAEFGNAASARAECVDIGAKELRRRRRAEWLSSLAQDAGYAWRSLSRAPAFALIAICTLGLGIGATTSIFSVVHAVLLRSLPYAESDELVVIWNNYAGTIEHAAVAPAEFADIVERQRAFAAVSAVSRETANLTGDGEPERVSTYVASPSLLDVLGVRPERGRGFLESDGQAGADPVVVLSHALWQRRFGGDAAIVGRTIQVNGRTRTVIGVLPREARFPESPLGFLAERAEMFVPYDWMRAREEPRGSQYLGVVARLRDGVSGSAGQADLDAIAATFKADHPARYADAYDWKLMAVPLREMMVGEVRPALLVVLGAVGMVLLIACVNIANLLLARGAARQRELAIRTSLGAGRSRIIRQLLTESMLLALAGAALGIALAWAGVRGLIALDPGNIPRLDAARIDGTMLLFAVALSLGAGMLFGLAPALQQSRVDMHMTLRAGSRGDVAGLARRVRAALVTAQVAMAIVVLIGAGLLVRSFLELQRVDLGIAPRGVLTFQLIPPAASHPAATLPDFHRRLDEQLRAVPGVTGVGAVYPLPTSEEGWSGSFGITGRATPEGSAEPHAEYVVASPGYFETLGVALRSGRLFTNADDRESPAVAIVDEVLERTWWPGESAIGKRLDLFGDTARTATIVGVVAHTRTAGPRVPGEGQLYMPFLQRPQRPMYYVVRGASPASLAPAVRAVVRSLDPALPLAKLRTMDDLVSRASARERFSMLLVAAFAATALLLASIGLYGVLTYVVSRRVRELGVRVALGATPSSVRRLVVSDGLRLVLIGVVAGIAAAAALSRAAESLLFEVTALDPLTYAAVAGAVIVVSLAACWIPAARASRVDPVEALRGD